MTTPQFSTLYTLLVTRPVLWKRTDLMNWKKSTTPSAFIRSIWACMVRKQPLLPTPSLCTWEMIVSRSCICCYNVLWKLLTCTWPQWPCFLWIFGPSGLGRLSPIWKMSLEGHCPVATSNTGTGLQWTLSHLSTFLSQTLWFVAFW